MGADRLAHQPAQQQQQQQEEQEQLLVTNWSSNQHRSSVRNSLGSLGWLVMAQAKDGTACRSLRRATRVARGYGPGAYCM